jgi:DNA-binding NarL/FixJ family response regulator
MGARQRDRRKLCRVMIVDDHPMVRERLGEVINAEKDLMVCGAAESVTQALEVFALTRPRLVLIDLVLKNSHGLDLVKALRQRDPAVLLLVVTMHDGALHAERVLRAGAQGFLCKQEATRNAIQAIRVLLDGGVYLGEHTLSTLTTRLHARRRSAPALSIDALTDRELRVFELLGQGYATRQVAAMLSLNLRTVETYRARMREKLGLATGTDLLQHAIRWIESGGTAA